jgi:drug/metabolite transporter (DMT)-like permease
VTVDSLLHFFDATRGETAALVAALAWAVASVIWVRAGRTIHPLDLNLFKGLIGSFLLLMTLAVQGGLLDSLELRAVLLLGVSGAVGIGLGDTAYFEAINCLGARRALLLVMLAPPLAGLTAWVFLGERLATSAWGGIALTIAGVAWVITERYAPADGRPSLLLRGVGMGFLASVAQVVGAVLSRAAFAQTTVTPLMSALLRMAAACVTVGIWLFVARSRRRRALERSRRVWGMAAVAAVVGTYVGITLQQFAFKYTDTGVAQTLLSTSPLFILPIAVWMGEKVTLRAVAGVVVALLGIAMLFGLVG